jgi:hypothetical protein
MTNVAWRKVDFFEIKSLISIDENEIQCGTQVDNKIYIGGR